MELNDIYLDENILYDIIQNLNLNDKMIFCKCNKKIYELFYKDIKYDIYNSLNDYKLYRQFMRRFEYDKYHLILKQYTYIPHQLNEHLHQYIFFLTFLSINP